MPAREKKTQAILWKEPNRSKLEEGVKMLKKVVADAYMLDSLARRR